MTKNTTPAIVLTSDDKTAQALVATIKSSVNGAQKYAAYVTEHNVTRDAVADHARALAVLAYPNDEPVQKTDGKRTRFGNAVQAAGKGLRTALGPAESKPRDILAELARLADKALEAGYTVAQVREAVGHIVTDVKIDAALAA